MVQGLRSISNRQYENFDEQERAFVHGRPFVDAATLYVRGCASCNEKCECETFQDQSPEERPMRIFTRAQRVYRCDWTRSSQKPETFDFLTELL